MGKRAERGERRVRGDSVQLRAFAGTDPVTKRRCYETETYPLALGKRKLDAAMTALLKRADEMAELRRQQRRDPTIAVRPPDRQRTVSNALDAWFQDHARYVSPTGRDNARGHIESYLRPRLGAVKLWQLRATLNQDEAEANPALVSVSAVYAQLGRNGGLRPPGSPMSRDHIRRIHATFHSALEYAVAKGWVEANPAHGARFPEPAWKDEAPAPEPEALAQLLARIEERNPALHAFVMVVGSGARPVEAHALRWRHVDLADGVLRLTADGLVRSIVDGKETAELRQGETVKRRKRNIALDKPTVRSLQRQYDWAKSYALMTQKKLAPASFVFSGFPGGAIPFKPGWAAQAFKRQVAAARSDGLDLPGGLRLYDIRHFLATQALGQGFTATDVAARLGNSATMVLKVYGHAISPNDRKIAEAMGDIWGPAAEGDDRINVE